MSKLSAYGSIQNKIKNDEMLNFAWNKLNEEQFKKLYKSYRQLFWVQLSVPIAAVVLIPLLCLVFSEYAPIIACFGAVLALILLTAVLILSQFFAGKLWHQYVKWYKKPSSMDKLYRLFE